MLTFASLSCKVEDTPALSAILERGLIDLSQRMIEMGADVNDGVAMTYPLLFPAISIGSNEAGRMLLAAGADANARW